MGRSDPHPVAGGGEELIKRLREAPLPSLNRIARDRREAADEIERLRALLSSPRVEAWKPIETAPDDGLPHLVTGWKGNKEGGERWYATAVREGGEWFPDDPDVTDRVAFYPPTHWMRLTPPALSLQVE